MNVEIPSALLLNLMRSTWLGERHRICGVLRGRGRKIIRVDRAKNVASTPASWSEIDPATLDEAKRGASRPRGLEFMGYFHSSSGPSAEPSVSDASRPLENGLLWLAVTENQARLWRIQRGGRLHGLFEPVIIDLVVGKRSPEPVAGVSFRGADAEAIVIEEPPPRLPES